MERNSLWAAVKLLADDALESPESARWCIYPADRRICRRAEERGVTVTALRQGDPAVPSMLPEAHGREIQAVAYLILRDRSEAEGVLMDTLLVALHGGTSLRDTGALRAWLVQPTPGS